MAKVDEKKKGNYIFPNIMAEMMGKMDMRLQLEASMMSMTLIMVGMIISVVYFTVYFTFPLWYKITVVINGLAGIVFLSSFLVTTFQQYRSYLEATEFQKEIMKMKGGTQEENAKKNITS